MGYLDVCVQFINSRVLLGIHLLLISNYIFRYWFFGINLDLFYEHYQFLHMSYMWL